MFSCAKLLKLMTSFNIFAQVCTKLIDASRMGDTARVSSLIDEGMDKNIQNKVRKCYVERLQRTLLQKQSITFNQEGNTALILASRNGHAAIVTLLVAAGADVHVKNKVRRKLSWCAYTTLISFACMLRTVGPPSRGLSNDWTQISQKFLFRRVRKCADRLR
jgi:ankyrin repeat protein